MSNESNKDVSVQVERALARQKAVIAKASTPEAQEHCLGPGGSNFKALAARTRERMREMEQTRHLGRELGADPAAASQDRALRLGLGGDKNGAANGAADIWR